MWNRISDWMHQVTSNRVALVALVVFLLFSVLVLPGQASQRDLTDSPGVGSPDLSFWYSADDLYRMADAYGERGRTQYVRTRFTFDVIWPLVYTLFLSTAITRISSRTFVVDSHWQRANLAPIWGALFDFLENISTSIVMLRYPERTPGVDMLASLFTMVKWVLLVGSFVLLIVGIMAGLWRWGRRTSRKRA